MLQLPFLKTGPKTPETEDFLGVILDPYKVTVVYFQPSEDPMHLGTSSSGASSPFISSDPETPQVKVICAKIHYFSNDSIFELTEDLYLETIRALDAILGEIAEEYSQSPRKVVFGLSPRNCIDLMSVVRFTNPERAKITEQQYTELYEQAERNAMFRAQDLLADQKGDMDTELVPITTTEVSLTLDEALVRDPVGLEGQELELRWFGSFAEADYLSYVQKIAKKLGLEIMAVTSANYAMYEGLKDSTDSANCILINFNSSKTDVAVVFGGSIVGSRYISMGMVSLIGEVSRRLSVHSDEALAILDKYNKGSLSDSLSVEVSRAIEKFSVVWLQALEAVFADFSGVKTFSSKVFVSGEGFDIPDFFDLVRQEPWFKSIPFKAPPEFSFTPLPERIMDLSGVSSQSTWTLPLSLGNIYFKMP